MTDHLSTAPPAGLPSRRGLSAESTERTAGPMTTESSPPAMPPPTPPVRAVYVLTSLPRPRRTLAATARGVRACTALLATAGCALGGAVLGLPTVAWWRSAAATVRQAVRDYRATGGA